MGYWNENQWISFVTSHEEKQDNSLISLHLESTIPIFKKHLINLSYKGAGKRVMDLNVWKVIFYKHQLLLAVF